VPDGELGPFGPVRGRREMVPKFGFQNQNTVQIRENLVVLFLKHTKRSVSAQFMPGSYFFYFFENQRDLKDHALRVLQGKTVFTNGCPLEFFRGLPPTGIRNLDLRFEIQN
jgi:hypothetical protein